MSDLVRTIRDIADRHEQRMRDDPRYAMTYHWMKEASRATSSFGPKP